MRRIRLSKNAADYVRSEAAYLRARNVAAARAFSLTMKNAQRILQDFPEAGNRAHGLQIAGSLTLVAGDYLLDYMYVGEEVHILTIRHGRMQMPLSDEDVLDDDGRSD